MLLLKIGPYDPQLTNKSKYESIEFLTRQISDPGINTGEFNVLAKKMDFKKLKSIKKIYCSSQKRAKGTVEQLKKLNILNSAIKVEFVDELKEIKFDTKEICSSKIYNTLRSTGIRKGFIKAFIDNKLSDSHNSIHKKVKYLEKIQKNYQAEEVIVISHTFLIKIYQIYKSEKELFKKPELIKNYIDPEKRIMKFLELNIV